MHEIGWSYVDRVMPKRGVQEDKNGFGRVLCVCGSAMYTGAAYFSAMGAVRMGSGVVTVAAPEAAWRALVCKMNEPVIRPMEDDGMGMLSRRALEPIARLAERADAVLIGCGLGQSAAVREIVLTLVKNTKCQLVIDADGINALSGHMDIVRQAEKPVILTPHAGEFTRLSGMTDPDNEALSRFAQANRCIVLRKGHRTRIAGPDGELYRNHSGNPGMAKGGSGDVLAGMIVSLCGQGLGAQEAACVGAFLHGAAGDLSANELSEYGMTPSDMLQRLPRLLKRYNTREW